jgi:hypothetical protein
VVFKEEYYRHRQYFTSVRSDAGLGIGIDCGDTALVTSMGALTVIGAPVVYACRYGAAPSGTTLLNQQAYSAVFEKYSEFCSFEETVLHIKNEGEFVAYKVQLNGKPYGPKQPEWMKPDEKAVDKG